MADEKKRSENRELNENELDKVSGGESKFYDGFLPDGLDDGLGGEDNLTGNDPDYFQPDPMIPYQP